MSNSDARYESLRLILTAAATAKETDLHAVLDAVCEAAGLAGAAVVFNAQSGEPNATVGADWAREAIGRYATDLWVQLLRGHQVESAYLQLAPDERSLSLFCYPLREGGRVAGAVLGLAEGHRNLSLEEDFLVALSTALAWVQFAPPGSRAGADVEPGPADADAVEKARIAAILETAIAVNHEVNNPLTAVLGNTQLLLLQADQLDPQIMKRLKAIEESALRIKEVTQKLLKQGKIRTTDYPGGLKMLDLSDSGEESDTPKSD